MYSFKGPVSGPCGAANDAVKSLAHVWLLFFPMILVNLIVSESTFYACGEAVRKVFRTSMPVQPGQPAQTPRSRMVPCHETAQGATTRCPGFRMTAASLICFFGVLIAMGQFRPVMLHDCWSSDINLRIPLIANNMKEAIFLEHLHFIHFVRDSAVSSGISKIKPILEAVQIAMRKLWTPGMRIVVDECSLACKAMACNFRQFNPNKPNKHHIKIFAVVDCVGGFMLSFWIYTGKQNHKYDATIGFVGDLLINKLLRPLGIAAGSGYVLFGDNWYSSISVALLLLAHGVYYVGTMKLQSKTGSPLASESSPEGTAPEFQKAAKFPFFKTKAHDSLSKGWMRIAQMVSPATNGKVGVLIYKCRKLFGMVHTAWVGKRDEADFVQRAGKESGAERAKVSQPSCKAHIEYNQNFGWVDKFDQLVEVYKICVQSKRWYIRIFFWVLDMITYCMWCICRERRGQGKNFYNRFIEGRGRGVQHRNFVRAVGESLIAYATAELAGNDNFYQPERIKSTFEGLAGPLTHEQEQRKRRSAFAAEQDACSDDDSDRALVGHSTVLQPHAMGSTLRCYGCLRIAEMCPKYHVRRSRFGCTACGPAGKHICSGCNTMWSHTYGGIPQRPPRPFQSWAEYSDACL
jgi:hypothetical protein